jgi:hypothetical protein
LCSGRRWRRENDVKWASRILNLWLGRIRKTGCYVRVSGIAAEGAAAVESNRNARIKRRPGRASKASLVSFLVAIALAGFAGAYLPATGSSAKSASTTVPKPDPSPPTTRSTPPPPPPRYVPPPPPPPSYVPPPPPPAYVAPQPSAPAVASTRPRRPVHRTPKRDRSQTVAAAPKPSILKSPPEPRRTGVVAAGLPVGRASHSWRVPTAAVGLLALSFLLMLLTFSVVLLPERALPERVASSVDGRREALVFFALCAVGVGLVLAFLAALVTS